MLGPIRNAQSKDNVQGGVIYLSISAKAVEKHLANLKADGIIEHIGPAKGEYWKVK